MEITEKDKKELDILKIGKLVKNLMSIILEKDLISENEIQNLLKKDYSKFTFNVIFPILKKVDKKVSLKDNGMINGNPRYYAKPIENRRIEYLLTNEWKEYNREDFMNWLKRKVTDL
jgi:hypothetical protein